MNQRDEGSVERLISAFRHSINGLRFVARTEASFRQEIILFIVALPIAAAISNSLSVFVWLMGSILVLMTVELINTAIEAACDGISRDYMDEIRIAKDCGSAAVLLAALLAISVWATVLAERLFL